MTKSKIVATLGPKSSSDEMVESLIKAGADVFRLNMSHGEMPEKKDLIRRIRALTGRLGIEPVGILGDLCGPKIRVGRLRGGTARLVEGEKATLLAGEGEGDADAFYVSYYGIGKGIKKGAKVLIDDGMLELKVINAVPGEVLCRVVKGGTLKERKGVNFPGMPLDVPAITKKDAEDLAMLLEEGVDYIALSFVREPEDVLALKKRIKKAGHATPVIAKIERPEAIKRIKDIVKASDGVMVARGDLGVEMAPELVPSLQKKIIALCNEHGKPVITATQMLESMIWNPMPTRAEASDVAGAVDDGTDALMLSGETADGKYPLASVVMMDRIAREAEAHINDRRYYDRRLEGGRFQSSLEAVASSACRTADALKAKAIICFTRTGATALLVSKYRPETLVIGATPDEGTFRAMRLYYGVVPLMIKLHPDTDGMIREVERAALSRGLVKKGDQTVVTLGVPVSKKADTNLMMLHKIGGAV